jgi:hypothetical protein
MTTSVSGAMRLQCRVRSQWLAASHGCQPIQKRIFFRFLCFLNRINGAAPSPRASELQPVSSLRWLRCSPLGLSFPFASCLLFSFWSIAGVVYKAKVTVAPAHGHALDPNLLRPHLPRVTSNRQHAGLLPKPAKSPGAGAFKFNQGKLPMREEPRLKYLRCPDTRVVRSITLNLEPTSAGSSSIRENSR